MGAVELIKVCVSSRLSNELDLILMWEENVNKTCAEFVWALETPEKIVVCSRALETL